MFEGKKKKLNTIELRRKVHIMNEKASEHQKTKQSK